MQDSVRIRNIGATARYSREDRDPQIGGPVPANEDSWPDPHQFEQDVRALFSDEDLAAMRQPANRATLDWTPGHDVHGHGTSRFAPVGMLAIALYAATALGAGLYFVLDPFGPGAAEPGVLEPAAASATEIASVPAAPSVAVVPPPVAPPVAPPVVAAEPQPAAAVEPPAAAAEAIEIPDRTAAVAVQAAPASTEPPARVVAELPPPAAPAPAAPSPAAPSPVAPAAAATSPEKDFSRAFSDVTAVQPKTTPPKAPDVFTPGQAAAHLARASSLLETGQIPAARAVLLLLAEQGNTEANYRYGRTFDPRVLAEMGAVGVRSDVEVARRYYGLAAAAGHAAAKQALETL